MGAAGAVVSTVMVRVAMSDILPVPSSAENETSLSPSGNTKESVQLPSESATVVVASAPSVPCDQESGGRGTGECDGGRGERRACKRAHDIERHEDRGGGGGLCTRRLARSASSSAKTHHNSDGCGDDRTLGLLRRGGGTTGGMIICGALHLRGRLSLGILVRGSASYSEPVEENLSWVPPELEWRRQPHPGSRSEYSQG